MEVFTAITLYLLEANYKKEEIRPGLPVGIPSA
jgi:hypothetical protein